jgi:hypothetical protein
LRPAVKTAFHRALLSRVTGCVSPAIEGGSLFSGPVSGDSRLPPLKG